MIKMIIIGSYIAHKVYWKRTHRENTIKWNKFFAKV
jgi:hypothetical protein